MIVNTQYNSNKSSFTFDDIKYNIQKNNELVSVIGVGNGEYYNLVQTKNNVFIIPQYQGYMYLITPQGTVPIMELGTPNNGWNIASECSRFDHQGSVFLFTDKNGNEYIIEAKNQIDLYNIQSNAIIHLDAHWQSLGGTIVSIDSTGYIVCLADKKNIKILKAKKDGTCTQLLYYTYSTTANEVVCAAGNNKIIVAAGEMYKEFDVDQYQRVVQVFVIDQDNLTTPPTEITLPTPLSGNLTYRLYSLYFDHFANKFVITYGINNRSHYIATSTDGETWKYKSINYNRAHESNNNIAFDQNFYYMPDYQVENYYKYDKNLNQIGSRTKIPFIEDQTSGTCGYTDNTFYVFPSTTIVKGIIGMRQQDFITINKEF